MIREIGGRRIYAAIEICLEFGLLPSFVSVHSDHRFHRIVAWKQFSQTI